MSIICVTGTDTEVGKTLVTAALGAALVAKGTRVQRLAIHGNSIHHSTALRLRRALEANRAALGDGGRISSL